MSGLLERIVDSALHNNNSMSHIVCEEKHKMDGERKIERIEKELNVQQPDPDVELLSQMKPEGGQTTARTEQKAQGREALEMEDIKAEVESVQDELDDSSTDEPIDEIEDIAIFEKEKRFPKSLISPSYALKSSVHRVVVLYNPASGAKKGERIAKEATQQFEAAKVHVDAIQLEKKGHAEELCQTMNFDGYDVICAIGGDGTFHECINGLMKRDDDIRMKIPLALIPGGTGNSICLELMQSAKPKKAIKHILRGVHCPIDISKLYFPMEKPENQITYSFNSIHWGLASKVNVTAEKLRWMGKAIRYTTAAMIEMMQGDKTMAKLMMIDENGQTIVYEEEFCLVIANNIVSAAKGMKMAPEAKLNDGLLDVLLIRSSQTLELVKIFQKTYDGSHTDMDSVEYRKVKAFSITPYQKDNCDVQHEPNPKVAEELIDVDGELKGQTPFRCDVIPRAVRIII